jgi:hypothetical protein
MAGKVEVVVGVVAGDEFIQAWKLRFEGKELDRYEEGGRSRVLYECGKGRYRIVESDLKEGSVIFPEQVIDPETGGVDRYEVFSPSQAAARWPRREHFAEFFPVVDIDRK